MITITGGQTYFIAACNCQLTPQRVGRRPAPRPQISIERSFPNLKTLRCQQHIAFAFVQRVKHSTANRFLKRRNHAHRLGAKCPLSRRNLGRGCLELRRGLTLRQWGAAAPTRISPGAELHQVALRALRFLSHWDPVASSVRINLTDNEPTERGTPTLSPFTLTGDVTSRSLHTGHAPEVGKSTFLRIAGTVAISEQMDGKMRKAAPFALWKQATGPPQPEQDPNGKEASFCLFVCTKSQKLRL